MSSSPPSVCHYYFKRRDRITADGYTLTRLIKQLEADGWLRWSGREKIVSYRAIKACQRELMIA